MCCGFFDDDLLLLFEMVYGFSDRDCLIAQDLIAFLEEIIGLLYQLD